MAHDIVEKDYIKNIDSICPPHMRIGTEFMVLEDYHFPAAFNDVYRTPHLTTIVFAHQGSCRFSIDMKEYNLKAPYMATYKAGRIIEHKEASEDFKATILVVSNRFFEGLFEVTAESKGLEMSVGISPVISLDETAQMVIGTYLSLLKNAVADMSNPMRLETVKHLTLTIYYGFGNRFMIKPQTVAGNREGELLNRFIDLVEQHHKEDHSLAFYADKMCLTPKYLSALIGRASGKTAVQWIDNAVILEAKTLLRCTDMTVSQITDELHFPDQSTFGKYFKLHVGQSPKDYRKALSVKQG